MPQQPVAARATVTAAAVPIRRAGEPGPAGVPAGPPGPPRPAAARPVPPRVSSEATVRAVPRRGHLGPLSLAQILVAEASLLALIAAVTQGPGPTLIAGAPAAALLVVFFARRQHRWWLEHRRIASDHRRRRTARLDTRAGPVLAALRTVAPGLTIRDLTGPEDGGTAVGVARDEAGWFSVVALDPGPADASPIPLDALAGLVATTEQPGVVLELVTHTVPAPSPDVHPASPAGSSYRQLVEAVSPVPVPAHRESSISVRVDARTLAEALLDHTADPEAAAELVAGLARKVATSLRRLGVTGRVLDAGEVLALLARSCDVQGPADALDETWTHWRSARLVHRTYWLKTWPASATEIGSLFAWAATAPAAQTSVALVLTAGSQRRPDGPASEEVAVRAFVRLATRPDADLAALDRVLLEGVRRAGAELQPLDGEHGPAAYATAPTGGGAG